MKEEMGYTLNTLKKIGLFFTLVLLLNLTPASTYASENDTLSETNEETLRIQQPIVTPESLNKASTNDSSQQAAASNVGYVDVWITGSPKKINWKVVVYPPYKGNGFNGSISITNLDSGLSHGQYSVKTMSGSMSTPILRSRYGAKLSGVLTYNGVTTGITMASPYLSWNNY